MNTSSITDQPLVKDSPDFSFVLGGPLFRLLRRGRLADDDLQLLRRRIIAISLFCWLPLLALSQLGGQVIGGGVVVPFLLDVEVHAKFLLAVPLLIGAELVVHRRLRHRFKGDNAKNDNLNLTKDDELNIDLSGLIVGVGVTF
jgi:hypothetical protein